MRAIISAIANAMAIIDHLWNAFNNSTMVKAKVDQMNQDDKDKHTELVSKAMNGATPAERAKALKDLRLLASE